MFCGTRTCFAVMVDESRVTAKSIEFHGFSFWDTGTRKWLLEKTNWYGGFVRLTDPLQAQAFSCR